MGKLNIVGLGYIGLPTGLMFATHGIEVVGTDLNKELVRKTDFTSFLRQLLMRELHFQTLL